MAKLRIMICHSRMCECFSKICDANGAPPLAFIRSVYRTPPWRVLAAQKTHIFFFVQNIKGLCSDNFWN